MRVEMYNALRERALLLRVMAGAGPGLLLVIVVVTVAASLIPAVSAVAMAMLVGRVADGPNADFLASAAVPLVVFGAALLLGHALEVVQEPLFFLATARIDGAHRAEVARLAVTSPAFATLEREDVRNLVWKARADPGNWTEKTPADGALTQLKLLAHGVSLVSLSVVLVAFSWWVLPLLLVAVVAHTMIGRRNAMRWYDKWLGGTDQGRRAEVWADAIFAPAEGKELRVFGFGGWAVERVTAHVRSMFEPVWAVGVENMRGQWRRFLLVLLPLTNRLRDGRPGRRRRCRVGGRRDRGLRRGLGDVRVRGCRQPRGEGCSRRPEGTGAVARGAAGHPGARRGPHVPGEDQRASARAVRGRRLQLSRQRAEGAGRAGPGDPAR
ncbi:hypothetical protein [Saccharothrix deserti]|uniref:hypothetical protein n=1 Tax=Saccharothrix deserti TaxID=2593674 RepID=UPI00192E333A|nr:hypothetical protein [Saccharothrix deserti]